MIYVTIDPGVSGGVCYWSDGFDPRVLPFVSRRAAAEDVRHWRSLHGVVFTIERVHASPVQGVSGAFAFGQNYGEWLGILAANSSDIWGITPQAWQRPWADQLEGLTGAKRKQALCRIAKEEIKREKLETRVTMSTCDAFLINLYLRRCRENGKPTGATLIN